MINKPYSRDYIFDNLKGLLIFLVVFGHFLVPMYSKSSIVETLYCFIYLFHMPLFMFISGYFSKRFSINKVLNLLLVYIIWQGIIFPLSYSILSNTSYLDNFTGFLIPKHSYWYLLSIIIYKPITHIIPKNYLVLFICILTSFIPGLLDGYNWKVLSLGRLISFYPYFYFGCLLSKESFSKFSNIFSKNIAKFNLIIIFYLAYYIFIDINLSKKVFNFSYSFIESSNSIALGIIIRVLLMTIAITSIMSICKLIPKDNTILSKWGMKTLTIYLSHAPFFYAIKKSLSMKKDDSFTITFILIGIILTYGYCEILSNEKVDKYISKFTNLKFF